MKNKRSARVPDRFAAQSQGLDVWQRLTRVLLACALLGVGVLVFSFFVPEWEKLREMDEVNAELEAKRDSLVGRKTQVLDNERRAQADRDYIEIIARDRLNLQKPGETIIRIDRHAASR